MSHGVSTNIVSIKEKKRLVADAVDDGTVKTGQKKKHKH